MTDRRTFLHAVGAAALGSALPGASARPARAAGARRLSPVGIQLYTLRAEMGRDFEGTLARVAEIGYGEVEFAGYFDRSPADVRAILDRFGLASPSTHLGIEQVRDDAIGATIESARTIGHRWLTVPSLPGNLRSRSGYSEAADILNHAGEKARAAGLGVAYHNHDMEFTPVEGEVPFDILLAGTDPELVSFEMDLYWISKAGRDPLEYLNGHPGRFPMVHVKDMDATEQRGMADPGKGIIDFPAIRAVREKAGIRHWFVEHDRPADAWQTARNGYAYLSALG